MAKHGKEGVAVPGAGGRLTRTEVTTVRLDPKLRFAAEIASRVQRRTVSSLIEMALVEFLRRQEFPLAGDRETKPLLSVVEEIWDPDESERFVNFARRCNLLLNDDEHRRYKLIATVFQLDAKKQLTPKQRKLLRDNYDAFVGVARGEQQEERLVKLRLLET